MKRKIQSQRPLQEEAEIKQLIESLQRDICVSIWHRYKCWYYEAM